MLSTIKRFKLIVLCCALIFPVTGCWGARETDDLGYILAMGIDKGKESNLSITFQLATLTGGSAGKNGGESEGDGGGGVQSGVITVEAASVFGALQLADSFISRDLTLMHNRTVIISAELAKEGLSEHINTFIRSREIRQNTFLLITPGKAADVLKNNKPIAETNVSRQLELLLATREYAAFLPMTRLHEINIAIKSPGSQAVAALIGLNEGGELAGGKQGFADAINSEFAYLPSDVPRQGGNKVDVIGMAVFQGDRLVGYLDGSETRYYQMAQGTYNSAIIAFPDPRKPDEYGLEIKIKKARSPGIKVCFADNVPQIEVSVVLEAEIISIASGIGYETGEKKQELERYLEDHISAEIGKVIRKTQEEYKSDIFGFGDHSRKYFLTWRDWENYGWLARYPDASISVNTNLTIRRTGLMGSTSKIADNNRRGEDNE